MKRTLLFIFASACVLFSQLSFAQDAPQISPLDRPALETQKPVDGQMVTFDAAALWQVQTLEEAKISAKRLIAHDVSSPSISPDGRRMTLFKKGDTLDENTLLEWCQNEPLKREIARGREVSSFVQWIDNETLTMRERAKPFFRDGQKLRYQLTTSKVSLRDRRPLAAETVVAYDGGDVIILESKKTKTLQAISDTSRDRYYGPRVSPNARFVAFNGLSTGLHIFDVEQNCVVYVDAHGTSPSFSPDGRYVIYTESSDDGHQFLHADLIVIDLEAHTKRKISNPTRELRMYGSLSQDAKHVAYSDIEGNAWRLELSF